MFARIVGLPGGRESNGKRANAPARNPLTLSHQLIESAMQLGCVQRIDERLLTQTETHSLTECLSRFSKLLPSSLELSREQRVPLEQEIEALEHYLVLQQMRFENSFSFKIIQPEDLEADAICVPPMLVQPFVENAILHGVDMKSHSGFVHIDFRADDRVLEVSITDSGRTRPTIRTDGHRSLSGIISRERLALLGEEARIETHKHDTGGTTVTIVIPIT